MVGQSAMIDNERLMSKKPGSASPRRINSIILTHPNMFVHGQLPRL